MAWTYNVKPRRIEYGTVQVFNNALPAQLFRELLKASRDIGWQFGWNTPSNPNTRYWHHEVGHGRKDNTADVSAQVRKHPVKAFSLFLDWLHTHLVSPDTKVLRFYLNAHTYGTDGWPHTDTDRPGELTAVLYLNAEWKPEWCGETVVFNDKGDIAASVLPAPNRLLSFPSHQLHAPRPLSKAFEGLRVVLVVKLAATNGDGSFFGYRPPMTEAESAHVAYLEQVGAHKIIHSGRTLLQHLWGLYTLLKHRNAAHEVCLAGLFHSIYDTALFSASLGVQRESVRARIGERAERLAWLFSALARPACWQAAGAEWPLVAGGRAIVNEAEQQDLRVMERANLDEQGILDAKRRLGL